MPEFRRDDAVEATPELQGEVPPVDAGTDEAAPAPRIPLGIRYMAAGAFFFSVMSLLVKVAGQRLPSQELVLVRAVITLLLSAWAVHRAGVGPWGTRPRRPLLVWRGVVGFLALSCFYYTLTRIPLADATVIQYTNPVWAGLLAVPLLGERLRGREVASVLVSMAGVLLVTRPSFLFGEGAGVAPLAVGIGLFGAMCSGMAYVSVRKLGATEHPSVILFYFALVSTIGSIPFVRDPVWPTAVEWAVLLGVGITTQLGQISITHGLRLERAGRASATAYLQVVFAATWGILFFAELPDAATVAGAVLIIGSTLALARRGAAAG